MKTSKNRGTYYSPFTAVQLYTSSLPRRVRDLHPLERAHGVQTKRQSRFLVTAVT